MKKGSNILIVAIMAAFLASCGPSEAQKRVEEDKMKREADSIKASIKADIASEMDSLKNEHKNSDSLVKEEKTKTNQKTKTK